METVFGLTPEQLLTLAGLGVVLVIVLLVAKFVFKVTMSFIKLGCLGALVVLLIACVVMLGLPG